MAQPDGKLVAIGRARVDDEHEPYAIVNAIIAARYLADGTLDASYGTSGVTIVRNDRAGGTRGAVLDAGGGVPFASNSLVGRLAPDGRLDPTFAPCGLTFNSFVGRALSYQYNTTDVAVSALQPDGKLVVAGTGFTAPFAMVRYGTGSPTCQSAAAAASRLDTRLAADRTWQPKVRWSWRSSGTVATTDFGDPGPDDGDSFTACLLDAGDPTGLRGIVFIDPGSFRCPAASCWTATRYGYRYKRRDRFFGSIGLRMRSGGPRTAKMLFTSRDEASSDVAPAPYTPPVTVRLERSGSAFCWEATFSTPVRNTATFTATSD
jgi:hypothetical protein